MLYDPSLYRKAGVAALAWQLLLESAVLFEKTILARENVVHRFFRPPTNGYTGDERGVIFHVLFVVISAPLPFSGFLCFFLFTNFICHCSFYIFHFSFLVFVK